MDRLVAGGLDASRRAFTYVFEFRREAAGGATVRTYRAWLARAEGVKLVAETTFRDAAPACDLPHSGEFRVRKPASDHLEIGLLEGGETRTRVFTEPRRQNAAYAVPLKGGYARFASTAVTFATETEVLRGVGVWMEATHDGSAGPHVPGEWTVAYTSSFDIWVVVRKLAGGQFATFTDGSGTYAKGTRNTYSETAIEVDPATKIALPRKSAHALAWSKSRIELGYGASWSESIGTTRTPLVNAILKGDGHVIGRSGGTQSVTGLTWILAQEPRSAAKAKGKKR
ncbi:MAG: hypothetical protein HY897_15355 [Deltaproteobacteria bacterium]|nr:hypothetical protein [Deltaproteobacteria bacterium]